MIITLDKSIFGNELFLNKFLIELNKVDVNSDIYVDISKSSWLSELQLAALAYILPVAARRHNKVALTYYHEDLFVDDPFFEYLSSSGFFDFIESHGIKTLLTRERTALYETEDPLIQFQSFQNIANKSNNVSDSRKLLYELTSSMQIVSDILKEEVFGKTDVSDKLARIITKELVENINLHSNAKSALVRVKYDKDTKKLQSCYGISPEITKYLERYRNTGYFILSISDDGIGLTDSLKSKYEKKEFIPSDNERLNIMLLENASWWLKRAFETHNVKDGKKRSRIGLYDILDTVKEYNGLMYVRTNNSSLLCISNSKNSISYISNYDEPIISGTHYLILLPALERKTTSLRNMTLLEKGKYHTYSQKKSISLETVDINYEYSIAPISTKQVSNEKYIEDTIINISKVIDVVIDSDSSLVQIDFANGVKERRRDYVHVLYRLFKKYGNKLTSNVILRNVATEVILAFNGSSLENELIKWNTTIIVFDLLDNIYFIGVKQDKIYQDLRNIIDNQIVELSSLNADTQLIVNNNNKIFTTGYIVKNGIEIKDKIVFIVPFSDIFESQFANLVEKELTKSKALVDGHYVINDLYHLDKYLVAHLMFQNPDLCRNYAKRIAILLKSKKPDMLVTYSSTGMILYYYLKAFYYRDLKLEIIKSPNDISHCYGNKVSSSDSVIIVTDVMSTGAFNLAIKEYILEFTSEENILAEIAVFDVSGINQSTKLHVLYQNKLVDYFDSSKCKCTSASASLSSVAAPEVTSALPTVYQKINANIEQIRYKKALLRLNKAHECSEKRKKYESLIDAETMTQFKLLTYWRWIQTCFQIGHVERKHTHFDNYDIPERLLFDNKTSGMLEVYIKEFSWSFESFVDFIVYPKDLTTSYLAHMVACRFLRKPKVAAAFRFSDGHLMLPQSITAKLDGKNVLIIDDACNTGITIKELAGLVRLYGGSVIGAFTITNRNSPENEVILQQLIPKVATAYRLNMDVYPKGNCPLCNKIDDLSVMMENSGSKRLNEYLVQRISELKVADYESI